MKQIPHPPSFISSLSESQKEIGHDVEQLLERPVNEDYKRDWTDLLTKSTMNVEGEGALSVVIFRLSQEWLALPTIFFQEVVQKRPIHRIPHRINPILLGVMNLEGTLQLCVNLHALLEIHSSSEQSSTQASSYEQMIALVKKRELWVFPVDEIEGIDLWNLSLMENIPVTVSKSKSNYLKGIMNKHNRSIGLLDEELLFYSLRRRIG